MAWRWRSLLSVMCMALFSACSPQAQLLLAVLPENTIPILLGHLQKVDETNRRRIGEFEQRQDWAGMAAFAEENIAKDRSNPSWRLVAGYAYSRQHQHARAIESFQEAVRLEPDTPEGWNLLGQEYRLSGRPERAVTTLNNALLVLRESPMTHFVLGESYTDLGRHDQAARAYRQAVQLDGGFTEAWAALALAHVRSGRLAEAREIVPTLEKTSPQLANVVKREIAAAEGAR